MNTTWTLHDRGQSLWLDNITRDLLIDGTFARYIDERSVTGLTSNPTIVDHAFRMSTGYDDARSSASSRSVWRDRQGAGGAGTMSAAADAACKEERCAAG